MATQADNTGARAWSLTNLDSPFLETVVFTFEAQNVRETHGSKYAQISSVGRQSPILQFLAGELKTISLTARLFARDTTDAAAPSELLTLRSWVDVIPALGRPPLLSLKVGDGHVSFVQCVMTSMTVTHVDRVQESGAFKGAEVALSFARYDSFSVIGGEPTDSRYHTVAAGEYYELIAQREYGDPLVGDKVRARNPQMPVLVPGDVVKLPSPRSIAQDEAGPRSVAFSAAFERRDTPQRARLRGALAARSLPYVSHVVKA